MKIPYWMMGKNGYYLGFKEEKTGEMVTTYSKTKKKVDELVDSAEKLVILFAAETLKCLEVMKKM